VASVCAHVLDGLPEIRAGDDLAVLIAAGAAAELRDGRVLVVAHKAVSKAEGAIVDLRSVQVSARARELAAGVGELAPGDGHVGVDAGGPNGALAKDPRVVQVVLDQTAELMRAARDVLICRTHHGFVCANAGVDSSNVADPDTVVTLPRDPDASARDLRARLRELTGATVAVLVTDSFGRAWRHGQCDVAIGCAGMAPLDDWRGRTDATGLALRATWLAVADAAAATADLVRAKDSREPAVIIEGLERFTTVADGPGAAALLRPLDEDLFR
jgi:coenzyme F420-0:L-glutamate ligase / coenzyme F420-1:gamma-L-glutamate ligase